MLSMPVLYIEFVSIAQPDKLIVFEITLSALGLSILIIISRDIFLPPTSITSSPL